MPTAASPSRRPKGKEGTRQALLDAALAEIVERGGDVPSIEALCARAGFTRGAFYVHFRDREHFVAELLQWVLDDIVRTLFIDTEQGEAGLPEVVARFSAAMVQGGWPDVESDIRAAYLAVLRELRPGSPVRARHAELMGDIIDRMAGLVAEGQRTGVLRADVDPRGVARFLLLSAIGTIVWDGVGIPLDQRLGNETAMRLLLAGH